MSKDFFDKNVFINCPFDPEYRELMLALFFATTQCGLTPRIALERFDSGELRLRKIIELISECKYGIHDLSRLKSAKEGQYSRLNLPFEVGLDFGCKTFHTDPKFKEKRCLLLETEQFSLHRALSDLAGIDVKCHHSNSDTLILVVRNWFVESGLKNIPGPMDITVNFVNFSSALEGYLFAKGFGPDQYAHAPVPEILDFMWNWLSGNNLLPVKN